MAQRRSSSRDGDPAAVKRKKGRCSVSGDKNEQPSVQHTDDRVDAVDVKKCDKLESVKCDLRDNGAKNQSPVSLSKQVVSGTPASQQSLKRRHKPNTMYANDFVFSSVKKSKPQKFESEPGLKQIISSANEMKKALLEREPSGSSSKKADYTVSTAKNKSEKLKLASASDITSSESHSSDAKKRGRKPKRDNYNSLTDVENVESQHLQLELNLSPRGAYPLLGEKAGNGRNWKSHLANTSLPDEQLRIGFDSLSDTTSVLATVPRKRGRPRKQPANEISLITGKEDVKCNRESSVAQRGNTAFEKLPSSQKFLLTGVVPHMGEKVSIRRDGMPHLKNISSPNKHLKTDSEVSAGPRKRGRPRKKSVDENIRKASAEDAEHYCESSLTDEHSGIDPRRRGRPPKKLTVRNLTKTSKGDAHMEGLVKEFACSQCSETFSSEWNIRSHMAHQHHLIWSRANENGYFSPAKVFQYYKNISCLRCQKRFKLYSSFNVHARWCGRENEMMKCEVCEKDILVRSYTYHMWYKHQEKKTKEDESAAVADVEGNKSSIRGSRAAAQKARQLLQDIADDETKPSRLRSRSTNLTPKETRRKPSDSEVSYSSSSESDSEFESDSLSDYEVRRSVTRKMPGKYRQNLERIVDDYYAFNSKQQSSDAVFADWKPVYEHFSKISPNDLSSVLPVNQDLSFAFQVSSSVTELLQLPLFDSFQFKDSVNINVGGPVWSLAWCPVGFGHTARQYLALYAHCRSADLHVFEQPSHDSAIIQVYDCGILSSSSRSSLDDKPKLAYGLMLNCGPIWEMKWCPARAWQPPVDNSEENAVSRLGLLAVATHSGFVHILAMPREDPSLSTDNLTSWYRATPCVTLTQYSTQAACLCVDWSFSRDCGYIAAGFADGSVSVWDLRTKSPLLRSYGADGRTVILRPFRTVSAHLWSVTSVAFCQRVPFMLVSCSLDRTVRTWDIREPVTSLRYGGVVSSSSATDRTDVDTDAVAESKPSVCQTSGSKKSLTGLFRKVVWPVNDVSTFSCASDECYLYQSNRCMLVKVDSNVKSSEKWKSRTLTLHNASVWDMSCSSWLQTLVSCDSVGLVMACDWPYMYWKKMPYSRYIVFTTELLHSASDSDQAVVGSAAAEPVMQDSKDDISQQKGKVSHDDETGDDISMENAHVTNTTSADTDTKTKERKPSKIIFKDYYIDSKWNYDKPLSFPHNMPADTVVGSRYAAVHRLAWNPNLGSHQWLAVAGSAGLLRILCVQNVGAHQAVKRVADLVGV